MTVGKAYLSHTHTHTHTLVRNSQVLLHISATTTLSVIVQTLPKFLGNHIDDIVLKVSAKHILNL